MKYSQFAVVLCVVVGFSICSFADPPGISSSARSAEPANPAERPQPASDSGPEPQQDKEIDEISRLQLEIMKASNPKERGQHPKHHGCVDAELAVLDNVPEKLRVGLFKEPARYKALVRFSNGSSHDDMVPDVHGMMIRLLDVKGKKALPEDKSTHHDILLVDSETFFADTVAEVLPFIQALEKVSSNPDSLQEYSMTGKREKAIFNMFLKSQKAGLSSPLAASYWSTVPYGFGKSAVKYSVRPAASNRPSEAKLDWQHYLREAMVNHLSRQGKAASFDFFLQVQTDAETDPIDTPTVRWKSKPVKVAVLTIHPQQFDTPERRKICEQTAFSPWIAIEEHAPLGQINAIRKVVYQDSAALRGAKPQDEQQ